MWSSTTGRASWFRLLRACNHGSVRPNKPLAQPFLRGFLKTGAIGYGLHVNPSSWDGSNLFVPKGSAFKLVTEPVMRALTRARVTNLEFEPISEVEVPLI